MGDVINGGKEEVRKHLGPFLTASVALALYILYFEVITISRSMALAFNIPNQYVGIYFSKLFGFYDFSTTIGSIIDITIYYGVKHSKGDGCEDEVRKGISVSFLFWIFICRTLFVVILYKSRSMSYHFYILFSFEAFFFGFAQISYFAYAGEFSSANTLAINCSALLAFLVQTILDWIMPSNPLKMLRIHSFICFGITLFSLGSWPYFLFQFDTHFPKNQEDSQKSQQNASNGSVCLGKQKRSLPEHPTTSNSCSSTTHRLARSADTYHSSPQSLVTYNSLHLSSSRLPNILHVSEMAIMSHIVEELKRICSSCNNMSVSISIRDYIYKISQISSPNGIDYELLVTLDLIIVGIRNSLPCENCLVLKQLVLFLRIKAYMNESTQTSTQASVVDAGHSQVLPLSNGSAGEEQRAQRSGRLKREAQESQTQTQCSEGGIKHFGNSMSRFLLFHIPSFFKDFLFPAILPYGLLEVNKCQIINMLVPIFTVLGSLTNYIWTEIDKERNENWDKKNYDYIWLVIIPIIIVYICSLLSIHSNIRFFRAIVNSQWRVIIMMFPLLYFYEFMVNVSYSGVADYVFGCKGDKPKYVLETHNLTCMLFPYLFCKISVGYNDVRIKSGYVLPNFRPVPGLKNTFCYWFCNIFKHAWYDIVNDFKFDIKKYL